MPFQWHGDEFSREVRQRANDELTKLGNFLVDRMKQLAPVDTGFLRDSIEYEHRPEQLMIVVRVGPGYGIYQEFGTRFIKPHPYIRPALFEAAGHWKFGAITVTLRPPLQKSEPLRASSGGFKLPRRQKLTTRQIAHVNKHLRPTSRRFAAGFKRRKVKFSVIGPQ